METRKLDNFETINFSDFESLLEEDKLDYLARRSGILGIHCFKNDRTLLLNSLDLLITMESFWEKFESGFVELSKTLENDFNLYGMESFAFVIIQSTEKRSFEQSQKEDEDLVLLQKSWPHLQYEDSIVYFKNKKYD